LDAWLWHRSRIDERAELMGMEDYDVIVVGADVPRAPDAGCAKPVPTQEVMS
jgi:hypothetical protein